MNHRTILGALLALVTLPAFAGSADVCYSAKNVSSLKPDVLTSSTPFHCPIAGQHTLPELAQAGWSVVTVQSQTVDYVVDPKTQMPTPAIAWMIVVQKESK